MAPDAAAKQVTQYNKVVSHVHDLISKAREDWEGESSARSGVQQTSSMTETHILVAAVGMGKGLKAPPGGTGSMAQGGMMVPPTGIRQQTPISAVSPSGTNPLGKMPSSIKTNIKSANHIHPYSR